ncbi:capsular exopolysaccharide family [Maribacter dokdonensis]|uniref:non-specific protein-tyrosine kinase n=1 Tax=Maribacter dokdonensis TaxID=320912 RepID=A0A1H4MEY4_9FLAO|nr:polysaccharide biosynthesis tyrosine autokinase [Maribacter dokdonensis]SEB81264.1 capsular exopolysaccharide family [Maribacter dokdonensis]
MFELNSSTVNSDNTNLRDFLASYIKHWYLFAIGAFLCIATAFLYLRYKAIPQYEITSTVLIKDKDKGSSTNSEQSLGDLGLVKPSTNIEDQIGIIKSTYFMEKVMEELALNVAYSVEGQVKDIAIYWKNLPFYLLSSRASQPTSSLPITITPIDSLSFNLKSTTASTEIQAGTYQYGDSIYTGKKFFQVLKNPHYTNDQIDVTPIQTSFINIEDMAMNYSGQLMVESVNKTGSLLALSLLDAIPQRGKDVLQTLIELYAEESVKYQNQLAIGTIEIIDERLKLLTGEITSVENDVATYKQQNDLTNISSDAAVYLQSAQLANRQLEEYQTQIDILNSIESYLRQNGDERLVPSSLNIQDPTLSGLISQFNSTQLERKTLVRTTPADNPLVVTLDRTLTDLRIDILENLRNIKDGLLIAQKNVQANSYRAQAKIAKVPTAERALQTINRDQGIKQDLYLYLLQKREEEALSLEAPISNTRIVDPPKAGRFPISPNKTSIYLGALILGLFIPFSFVFAKDQLNNKISGIGDIDKFTNAPVLGQISHNADRKNLIVHKNNTSAIAELFRLMRFNLSYLTINKANKVLLVTSSNAGEGKTFFTINFAASLALSGKKVVALSFDLRAPKLLQRLNLKESIGITDYIVDHKWTSKDLLVNVPNYENLDVIGSGPIPSDPGELMLHERISTLIEELKHNYDHIIIDSAPVGKVADAFAFMPNLDATVFIARQNFSLKKDVKILNDIYSNNKLKNMMVVLNDTEANSNYGYSNSYNN